MSFIFALIGFLLRLLFKYGLSAFFAYAVFVLTTRATNLPDLFQLKALLKKRRVSRADDDEPEGADASDSEPTREAPAHSRLRDPAPRKYVLPGILAAGAFLTKFAPDHPLFSFILLVVTMVAELKFVDNVRRHAQRFKTEVFPALGATVALYLAQMSYTESVRYHLIRAFGTTPSIVAGIIITSVPGLLTLLAMATLVIGFLLWQRSALEEERSDRIGGATAEELKKKVIKTKVLLAISAITFGLLTIAALIDLLKTIFGF